MGIVEYGQDRLPAGPAIDESEELIVVEGRADVLNLLKADIKNCIALNGTSVPPTMIDLCKRKIVTIFVDGDRGGDLIIKELSLVTEIDFVTKAPDGKEVEELAKKEIHKALRSRVAIEQVKMELNGNRIADSKLEMRRDSPTLQRREETREGPRPSFQERREFQPRRDMRDSRGRTDRNEIREERTMRRPVTAAPSSKLQKKDADTFKKMLEDLIGTRGAYILDESANILGKVPTSEVSATVQSLSSGIYAIVLDGSITQDIVSAAEEATVKYLVANESQVRSGSARVTIVMGKDL